ncbi:hypothetical protein Pyn_29843 [Prunus yedoensis var. nudiflora]|uniref:Uncharacterized protein n=1 Tax=Prunus yedoensis var. nudiflora TaxID=2094558 RepID=A0A314Z1J2_PRUYE|nr:hypothetical protein Pyn_29843 [Prunus yedoensis var. nudiflora]
MRHQSTKNFTQITRLLIPLSFLDNLLHNPTIFAQIHHCDPRNEFHFESNNSIGRHNRATPTNNTIAKLSRQCEQYNLSLLHRDHAMVQTLHHSTLTELNGERLVSVSGRLELRPIKQSSTVVY